MLQIPCLHVHHFLIKVIITINYALLQASNLKGLDILQTKSKNELIRTKSCQNEVRFVFALGVRNGLPKRTFQKSSFRLQNTFVLPLVREDYIIGVH